MGRRLPLALFLVPAATLAGCGGSGSTGEASKSASAITVDGQKATELKSSKGGSLFVATSGTPYPVEFAGGGTTSGTVTLSEWGTAKAPGAPKSSIDINALGK
jgi:hypothetical protein